MLDFWFQHLSAFLGKQGVAAYLWRVKDDRFEWAGDLTGTLGIRLEDCPADNAAFHKLLNPQHVPQRLAALFDVMTRFDAAPHGGPQNFVSRYKIRAASGAQIDVKETAVVQIDAATGEKVICGFMEAQTEGAAEHVVRPSEKISVMTDTGGTQYGRRAMLRRLEDWATGSSTPARTGYLLAVGMDRLSLMNEAFGAKYIDELIERTGERLREIAGDSGWLTRIDGDVFGIFFHAAQLAEMSAVARYILNSFYDAPVQTSRGPASVRVSIGGLALDVKTAREAGNALTKAETAMRTAKDRGRGCFVSYTEAASQAAGHRSLIQSGDEFLNALKNDRVRLAFQPVISVQSEQVNFHECLIRMVDSDGKLVPAAKFVPAIEKLGMSRLVDQYAMRSAIQELGLFPDLSLSVNVSNLTLVNPDWLRGVVSSLRDRPSIASRLVIEITESAVMADASQSVRVAKTLKELGCRVALDDFGTGYTAFSQIKDMEVDIVKIDKSFVRHMDEEQNKVFVRTLQQLADGVNVKTVGEGAESMNDVRRLTNDGINYIQGYFYGFPRVERVWLPKDHEQRLIGMDGKDKPKAIDRVAPSKFLNA